MSRYWNTDSSDNGWDASSSDNGFGFECKPLGPWNSDEYGFEAEVLPDLVEVEVVECGPTNGAYCIERAALASIGGDPDAGFAPNGRKGWC